MPFVLAALGVDFVDPRNLIGALVPLLIATGVGLGCAGAGPARGRRRGAAAVLCLVVLSAVYESSQMQRPDWRGAAAAMGPPSGPRVLVVSRNGNEPIAYYRGAREFRSPRYSGERVSEIDVLGILGATVTPPGKGFDLRSTQRLAPCCTLWRYRATRRTLIKPSAVAGLLLGPESTLVEDAR